MPLGWDEQPTAPARRGDAGEQPGRRSGPGLVRKRPRHVCSWAEPRNALYTEPPRGSYRPAKPRDPLGACATPAAVTTAQPGPFALLRRIRNKGHVPCSSRGSPLPRRTLWGHFPGLCLPRAGDRPARLRPRTPPGDIPWSSSLCCRCCSSIPRGRAGPCTPPRPGRAPSGTTTSAARWRLRERRASAGVSGTGRGHGGTRTRQQRAGDGAAAMPACGRWRRGGREVQPLSPAQPTRATDPRHLRSLIAPDCSPAPEAPRFLSPPQVKSLTTAPSSLPAGAGRPVLSTNPLQAPPTEATGPAATTRPR